MTIKSALDSVEIVSLAGLAIYSTALPVIDRFRGTRTTREIPRDALGAFGGMWMAFGWVPIIPSAITTVMSPSPTRLVLSGVLGLSYVLPWAFMAAPEESAY